MTTPRAQRRRLGLALAGCLAGGLVLTAASQAQEDNPWTTEDIIDEHIDVDAQYALMRMMSHDDVAAHIDASAILSAVKAGDLAGVYQADREVPAQRVRAKGGNWWQVVPAGFDAVCYGAGGSETPMIIYRKGVGGIPSRLDPALRSAWASCHITPAEPRPYKVTIHKPPPPPPPPDDDTPPAPDAGLTVRVVSGDGKAVSGAQVSTIHNGGGDTLTTGDSGTVTFGSVPAGIVDIDTVGPTSCSDDWSEVTMGSEPMTYEVILDCSVPPPPPPPEQCDAEKYSAVFDPCGRAVLDGAVDCLKDAYTGYPKCAVSNDWKCAGKTLGKFWQCKSKLDHKRAIQECNDKANAASNCKYKGPLD